MADEPVILDEDMEQVPTTAEESSAFLNKLSLLRARCVSASIEFDQQTDEEGDPYATLAIQCGRNKRKLYVYHEPRADALLEIEFEKYQLLVGYEGICDFGGRIIEVGVAAQHASTKLVFERLRSAFLPAEATEGMSVEILPPEAMPGRPVIEFGPSSKEFDALLGKRRVGSGVTLKLKGIRANQHEQALSELRSYADSVFFQIDMMYGATLALERERRFRFLSLRRKGAEARLAYPVSHFNEDAMSLYWYAKSAINLPLLRFLAFYQSIEFFFPRYSQTEARKRVGAIVKHPTFRPYHDDDLDRLVSAIRLGRSGGIGNERSQLRAAINECINADEVRQFLLKTKEREAYFSGKSPKYHRISVGNKAADLRNDVADRIYGIRCKIVHTKNDHSDDDVSMILPFSEDADQLMHDIDLVEFVASKVLVSASSELV